MQRERERQRGREILLYSTKNHTKDISINISWINKTKTSKISSVHVQLQV